MTGDGAACAGYDDLVEGLQLLYQRGSIFYDVIRNTRMRNKDSFAINIALSLQPSANIGLNRVFHRSPILFTDLHAAVDNFDLGPYLKQICTVCG